MLPGLPTCQGLAYAGPLDFFKTPFVFQNMFPGAYSPVSRSGADLSAQSLPVAG